MVLRDNRSPERPGNLIESGAQKGPEQMVFGPRLDVFELKTSNKQNGVRKESKSQANQPIGRFRHVIAVLALSGILLANMNRQAYNQALVRMVRIAPTPLPDEKMLLESTTTTTSMISTTPEDSILSEADDLRTINHDERLNSSMSANEEALERYETATEEDRFDWTGDQIGLLQAAFAYGYTPFMIPGGRLSEIYGAKWVIFLSGFGSALCTLFTPILADYSFVLLVGARVMMGICQTGISPALYALLTRWLPPEESSVYLAMIKVAIMIGFMLGSLINGFIPWRLMFLLVGLVGLGWSLIWTICVSSQPEEHKFLGKSELEFIKTKIHAQAMNSRQNKKLDGSEKQEQEKPRSKSAPWLNILTNPVVIAFTVCKFSIKLSTDAQSMQLPMYLRKVFNISDQMNGLLVGANFAMQALFTGLVAYVAKEMLIRKTFGMNKTQVRRLFQGINNLGMGCAYLLISFNFGSLNVVCCAVLLLSFSSMFGSGGEAVLPVDLTTEYSASIMAIANSAANLSGMVLPPMVSLILSDRLTSSARWNCVWWFVGGSVITGGLIFCCFVEANLIDFDDDSSKGLDTKKKGNSITKGAEETIIEMTGLGGAVTLLSYDEIKT